ncbi:HEPN domain-containing protein [Sulfurimonas sp.]|uniref:HEPN domain-containing protein n=1 Tax=Sulfurimonas sp. TaxID=2022749 RepID=UPI0025DEC360|nr:HEPN domain-containing protein [Sulfurimonas sp.]
MRAFTKEWLKAAQDDLMTIEEIIENDHLTHIVAFHSQQCVEKVMKAIIEEEEIDIPKIHKLSKLYEIVSSKLKNIDTNLISILDSLYIESRYPGDMGLLPHGKPTLQDAKEFYEFAKNIYLDVERLLNAK